MSKIRNAIDRMKVGEDIGLDRSGQTGRQRTVNPDGSYNMERITGRVFGNFNPFYWVITTSWAHYWLVVFGFYGIMNVLFASTYYFIGIDQLSGMRGNDAFTQWLYCFFFSAQSFTTVGYGGIHPVGKLANLVATMEAFIGLMTFALATGTLYGRFSKAVPRIKYSKNILIAPYKDITAMQFMVANEMDTALMEVNAKVNLSWMDEDDKGNPIRRFQQCKLEFDKIAMFPTSWVINHPIDEESALFERSLDEIKKMDFEVFVVINGFDDTTSQTIYSRQSFIAEQFIYGAKFRRPFSVNDNGKLIMDLTKVGDYDLVPIQKQLA